MLSRTKTIDRGKSKFSTRDTMLVQNFNSNKDNNYYDTDEEEED